ncbi:aminotransferase class V-fold PLP-dependent enzyme [Kineococcus rhizosphaerae]|uniref:Selenocysteine lyase/cysteine desulfurase n=1 Tax=Kineococcus rhizosphaerae TaxID=559628 RepID=A0A2T0R167_9ACTN|nr:aminotransferase class V-fold PLP-dependent enzyme [Kineococcus rhizosphaerae]PRY13074.1 selenocysteine lyase/cysteine desulfurase [Kineococcus rhizosphaerae]
MSTSTLSPSRPAPRAACRPVAPLLPVVGADTVVPLATGGTATYANLDNAASAPALSAVAARVAQVLPHYASVHRGAGYLSRVSTALFEQAREQVGRFLGARADDVVVFTRSTTDALDLLSRAVPAGARVLVADVEHHANLLPWQRSAATTVVRGGADAEETAALLEAELATGQYALLAVAGASNVTGEVLPLRRLARAAHAAGARIAVDGAQLLPHRRVDVGRDEIDWIALSGHKLYAPFGAGALVGRRDWLDAAEPYLAGGGATLDVSHDAVRWASGPDRHEAGSPNVIGAVALAQACATLAALPDGALERHEGALRAQLVDGLSALPGVEVVRAHPADAVGVVTFTVAGRSVSEVAAYLSAEHGIGVRDGRFCAHRFANSLGLVAGGLRASTGVGTGSADVERLVAAVERFVTTGPELEYGLVDGHWGPLTDARPAPETFLDPVTELG